MFLIYGVQPIQYKKSTRGIKLFTAFNFYTDKDSNKWVTYTKHESID